MADGLTGSEQPQPGKAIEEPLDASVERGLQIQPPHLCTQLVLERRHVAELDGVEAVTSLAQRRPEALGVVSDRGDDTHPGNNDAVRTHRISGGGRNERLDAEDDVTHRRDIFRVVRRE